MCQGLGLSKHDVAMRMSEATGRGFENVLMDLARVPTTPMGVDTGRISEKTFGQFARSQGIGDWDAAGLVSDMTGMDIETAHHKLTVREVADIPQSNTRQQFRPFPFSPSSENHGAGTVPLGSLRAPSSSRQAWTALGNARANSDLLATVRDSDLRDSVRVKALDELIENGAVDELYAIVNDSDRRDSWRVKALNALLDLADRSGSATECLFRLVNNADRNDSWRARALETLRSLANRGSPEAMDYLFRVINNTDRSDSWRSKALDTLCGRAAAGASDAADYLYRMINNTDRSDSWRHRALKALIRGAHQGYLRRIAANTDRSSSWRREAREALGE